MEAEPVAPFVQTMADAVVRVLRDGPDARPVRPEVERLIRANFPLVLVEELARDVHVTADAATFACVLLESDLASPADAARAITSGEVR